MKTNKELTDSIMKVMEIVEKAEIELAKEDKTIYCNLCNGEDKASICKWCYSDAKKGVPKRLLRQKINHLKRMVCQSNYGYLGCKEGEECMNCLRTELLFEELLK